MYKGRGYYWVFDCTPTLHAYMGKAHPYELDTTTLSLLPIQ
jgi:hypothetical protein